MNPIKAELLEALDTALWAASAWEKTDNIPAADKLRAYLNSLPDEPAPSPTKPEGLEWAVNKDADRPSQYYGDWRDTKETLVRAMPGYMNLSDGERQKLFDLTEIIAKIHPAMTFKCGGCGNSFSRVWQYRCADCNGAYCQGCIRPHFEDTGTEGEPYKHVPHPVSDASGEPKRDIGITQEWFERKVKLEEGHEIGAGAEIPDGCVVEQDITTNPPTWFYQIGRGMAVSQGGYPSRTEAVNALHTCLCAPLSDADTVRVKREDVVTVLEGMPYGSHHNYNALMARWSSAVDRLRASLNGGAL